jgi:hypothetical protein
MHLKDLIRKDKWPLHLAVLVLIVPVLLIGRHLLQSTAGAFSLPHDEAFLQLSTAKALAFRHIWGIGRETFASASPSLLYPVVMAVVFFITGAHLVVIPIINTLIAVVLLASIQEWLAKRSVKPLTQLFILLTVIVLTPLPLIVMYGMERPLLLLFAFLFVSRLSDEWATAVFSRKTLIFGALMVAARYDGVLLVAGISFLLIYRRKWLEAFELALWCLLPILVFGIVSLFKGSYFLPNVFLLEPPGTLLSYDWLVGCGTAVAVPLLSPYATRSSTRNTKYAAGLTAILVILLLTRNVYAFREADRSSLAINRLAYPAGQFAHRYYYYTFIASDDIGLLSFFTDGYYLDLSGLASPKIARSRANHYYNQGLVRELGEERNLQLAIVSKGYERGLPEEWIRTASWETPDKKTLLFYARDSASANRLINHMEEYASLLPHGLTVSYFYSSPENK